MARQHAPFRNRYVQSISVSRLKLLALVWLPGCSLMVDVDRFQCAQTEDCARRGVSGVCVRGVCAQEMRDSSMSAVTQPSGASPPATLLPESCGTLLKCCARIQDEARREPCIALGAHGDASACSDALDESCMSTPPAGQPQDTACMALEPCCAERASEVEREECRRVLDGREPDACTAATAQYCGSGLPDPQPSAACDLLDRCCRALYTDDDDACTRVVAGLDEVSCSAVSAMYCVDFDPTLPESCIALGKCCSNLRDDDWRHDCESVTADRDPLACEHARENYCVRRRTP